MTSRSSTIGISLFRRRRGGFSFLEIDLPGFQVSDQVQEAVFKSVVRERVIDQDVLDIDYESRIRRFEKIMEASKTTFADFNSSNEKPLLR